MQDKKVLLVDADPQGDLTTCLGWQDTDSLAHTLANKLSGVMREETENPFDGILHHEEKVDLVPFFYPYCCKSCRGKFKR